MIRLFLNSALLKSLNFNKKEATLEIEFKDDVNTADCLDIPISTLQDYVDSLKLSGLLENVETHPSNLKIVHSNFKAKTYSTLSICAPIARKRSSIRS